MSKKKAVAPKIKNLEKTAASLGLSDAAAKTPWSERKQRAIRSATNAGFDVERILFGGSLEDLVTHYVNRVIDMVESYPDRGNINTLEAVGEHLAQRLSAFSREDMVLKDDCLELALSFLYLFPKLWKALDKVLSLRELKALDLEGLLSRRPAVPRTGV